MRSAVPQVNLHRALTASQLRNKHNKGVFCSVVHIYLHTEENMEQLVEVVCTDPKWLASLFSVRYPWCFLVTGLKSAEDWSEMLDSYQTSQHWFIIHKKDNSIINSTISSLSKLWFLCLTNMLKTPKIYIFFLHPKFWLLLQSLPQISYHR